MPNMTTTTHANAIPKVYAIKKKRGKRASKKKKNSRKK